MKLLTTHAPLPKWKNLFRIFLPFGIKNITKPWHFDNEVAGRLSRSAWSLALIAVWRKKNMSEFAITIWVPEFFCNASLAPLRELDVNFIFYPLNDKMEPDSEVCKLLAINTPPDIFILVHYFGQPNEYNFAVKFCFDHGAWLVEDAAHALKPVNMVGKSGDFVLYSPHKHLPIPDGAILVVRSAGPSKLKIGPGSIFDKPLDWHNQLKNIQIQMGTFVDPNHFRSFVWIAKRVLQKFGIHSNSLTTPFRESIDPNPTNTSSKLEPPSQSILGIRLLAGLCSEIDIVAEQRKKNQDRWDELFLKEESDSKISLAERPAIEKWTPYLAAYKADSGTIEEIYCKWQSMGLPVLTWPDLPPEVTVNNEVQTTAWKLRHSRIYLPVHQSLNFSKILPLQKHVN